MTLQISDPAMLYSAASANNYSDLYFYLNLEQSNGYKQLPTSQTINGITAEPIVLLYGDEATTISWPNRGSHGGSLTAVNIRDEDLGFETPYNDTTCKAVRLEWDGVTKRYFQATDAALGDIDLEDCIVEAVYARSANALPIISWFGYKRAGTATATGYAILGTNATAAGFQVRPAGQTIRTTSITTSIGSWCYSSAYYDASDTDVTGTRHFSGATSSGTSIHAVGSLSNLNLLTIGYPSDTSASYANSNGYLAYLAIWKVQDWFASGAQNTTDWTNNQLERSSRLAGYLPTVPNSGASRWPTTFTGSFSFSQKIVDGKLMQFPISAGNVVTSEYFNFAGTEQYRGQEYFAQIGNANLGAVGSEVFSGWTPADCSVATNTEELPCFPTVVGDGGQITSDAGTAEHSISATPSNFTNGQMIQYSAWLKAGACQFGWLRVTGASNTDSVIWYDLDNGTIGTQGSTTGGGLIDSYNNGWYRCLIKAIGGVGASTSYTFSIGFSDTDGYVSYNSPGQLDGYCWGAFIVSSNTVGYPIQQWPYSPSGNVNSPTVVFPGSIVTAAPYSMYGLVSSPKNVAGDVGGLVIIQYSTDNNNFSQLTINGSSVSEGAASNANLVGSSQWTFATSVGSPNRWADGVDLAYTVSMENNNIDGFYPGGTQTDTSATVPTGLANIRIGNNAAGIKNSRGTVLRQAAIFNTVRTNNLGPNDD